MGNCLQTSNSDDINLVHSTGEPDDIDDDNLPSARQRWELDRMSVSRSNDERHRNVAPPAYENSVLADNAFQQQTSAAPAIFHPTPGVSRTACQLTEEEQIKIAQRIGLIQHLPIDVFAEASKTDRECIICMMEFCEGDHVRFLPCLHTFHVACIDDWLMRAFTCPSCLEPVDSALLTSYDQNADVAVDGSAGATLKQQLDSLATFSPGDVAAAFRPTTTTDRVVVAAEDGAGVDILTTSVDTDYSTSNRATDLSYAEDDDEALTSSDDSASIATSASLSPDGARDKPSGGSDVIASDVIASDVATTDAIESNDDVVGSSPHNRSRKSIDED